MQTSNFAKYLPSMFANNLTTVFRGGHESGHLCESAGEAAARARIEGAEQFLNTIMESLRTVGANIDAALNGAGIEVDASPIFQADSGQDEELPLEIQELLSMFGPNVVVIDDREAGLSVEPVQFEEAQQV